MKLRCSYVLLSSLFLLIINFPLHSQDKLLSILHEELNREFKILNNDKNPVYYMEYRVTDFSSYAVLTSLGSLIDSYDRRIRYLDANLKIGNYNFDNTHATSANQTGLDAPEGLSGQLPIEDNSPAIKQTLWKVTNSAYENALQQYLRVRENPPENNKNEKIPDFSGITPETYYEPPLSPDETAFDKKYWEEKMKEYTGLFLDDSSVFNAEGMIRFSTQRKYFISSEGSSIVQNQSFCQLYFIFSLITEDGTYLPYYKSFTSYTPAGMPSDMEIRETLNNIVDLLKRLKSAPQADPFTGPAILSPAASGVFFHEIFGHRVEGHRLIDKIDSQTFKGKIGHKYLPEEISITFKPQEKQFQGTDLFGYYKYDDQGVKGQSVNVIEKGILRNFLLSRKPVNAYSVSNGHGRAQAGSSTVSRQSNMFIHTEKPVPESDLRKKLIKACKKQNKEYGYYFKEVTGGFTQTTRYSPNVFNIYPIEVYRVYVDGRPDELVRGVNLIGTPLVMFSEIIGTGGEYGVFNGICGAESGQVPVSTISPSILVNKIETQRQPDMHIVLPILPRPGSQTKQTAR